MFGFFWKKFWFQKEKFRLRYRYWNWTFVWFPIQKPGFGRKLLMALKIDLKIYMDKEKYLKYTVVCILVRMKSFSRFWTTIQNGRLNKPHFSVPLILNIFSWKIHGLVLGLIELIDAMRLVWLILYTAKKTQKCIFCLFLRLCKTASRPYQLRHTNVLCINRF